MGKFFRFTVRSSPPRYRADFSCENWIRVANKLHFSRHFHTKLLESFLVQFFKKLRLKILPYLNLWIIGIFLMPSSLRVNDTHQSSIYISRFIHKDMSRAWLHLLWKNVFLYLLAKTLNFEKSVYTSLPLNTSLNRCADSHENGELMGERQLIFCFLGIQIHCG